MTGKDPARSRSASLVGLVPLAAAAILTACSGGAGGALLPGSPSFSPPSYAGAAAERPSAKARIEAPRDTVAVRGKVLSVSPQLLTLETGAHVEVQIVIGAGTVTTGGTPVAGESAQVVGRGTTKITALYLALWQGPPPALSLSGTIAAPAVDGFMLSTPGSQPVRVVLSSQAALGTQLAVGETVQAIGEGSLVRGIVAKRISKNLPSPSPSASPVPTPSPTPTGKATAAPTATPTADPTATPTPKPTSSPTPVPVPTPTPTPAAGPTLPPEGVYNSCEIDTALTTMCEQEDAAMASDGFTWEINYIGVMATKATLKSWFTYDASIGMGQVIAVNRAINDPVNPLTGSVLVTFNGDSNLAASCGATNNEQIISCIDSVANSVPGFKFKWYLYDEPGCPNQSIGYCQGTLAGGNYNNVSALAQYIASIDSSHQVIGTEVGDVGSQTVTNTEFSWLMSSSMPAASGTGFDHYPVPEGSTFGHISDNGTLASQLATASTSYDPSESLYYVGQAFSWYQEDGAGCTSLTVCPYPTTAQMQEMRDQVLYYAALGGHPMSMVFWYYWPDVTCMNGYSGCSASANRASLKTAAFAPFPTSAPSLRRRSTNARPGRARP